MNKPIVFTKNLPKILVILGPTSSGKTRLAVSLTAKFNGEIVSADSRQVYKGMDIGTGKDLNEYKLKANPPAGRAGSSKLKAIPYHLIDVVSPKTMFNLAEYQKLAYQAIDNIISRGKLPVLTGGTGLYLQAVIDGYDLSEVKPDKKFRIELEKKTIPQLFSIIEKINKKFAEKINDSDRKNKRRLIRYVEILNVIPLRPEYGASEGREKHENFKKYNSLIIGISTDKKILNDRIQKRLTLRLEKEDMIGEVKRLHREGLSWKRLENFGLEYKFISLYLQKKLTYDEMAKKLFIAIRQFSRRQMTWFRRWQKQGAKINWIKNFKEAEKLTKNFIK